MDTTQRLRILQQIDPKKIHNGKSQGRKIIVGVGQKSNHIKARC